jgi:minor histocompatibility antigen H13
VNNVFECVTIYFFEQVKKKKLHLIFNQNYIRDRNCIIMAEPDVMESVTEKVAEAFTEAAANVTAKVPATPEGMAIAYGSLVLMALVPIYFGSFRSVRRHAEQVVRISRSSFQTYWTRNSINFFSLPQASGEKGEKIMSKDAAMFPIFASAALFGLYIVFRVRVPTIANFLCIYNATVIFDPDSLSLQIFSKEYINMLLTVYFFCLGVGAFTRMLR